MPEAPMAQLSKPLRMCILGGGGYLGQTLAKVLQSECAHFTVLFDVNFTEFSHIQLEEELTLRIKASIYDDMDQLLAALEGCDACFHIAGYGMSGGPSLDRQKCMDVNVGGTENVIEACKRMGVARLIFTSSVSVVFDGQNELHMADEESTPYVTKFGNPYVEAKCLAEQMLLRTNNPPQLATCAIRLRGIYGPGELRSVQRCVNLCLCGVVKCTFAKSEDPLTQYSSVENSVNALMLVEKSLRNVDSPAAGNKYHIVDGGPPVHPWAFWYPLIAALGCPLPFFRVPYSIIVALAFLFEQLYKLFGVEPLFTRYEVALLAITNTFSIRRAQQDFGYSPVRSHDLRATIQFCQQQLSEKNEQKGLRKRRDLGASSRRMLVAGCWLFDGFTGLLGLSKCAFLLFLLFFASSLFLPVEALGSGWNCLGAALRRLMQSIGTTFFSCC